MNDPIGPVIKYPGAKWRLAEWILSHMPEHESYLEPYAGSLAVLLNKPPARIETVNDLDGEIVNFFRVCRSHPQELARLLRFTPWARAEHEAIFTGTVEDPVERARRFTVQCWMTFGAGNTGQRGWRHSTGTKINGGPDNPKLWARMPETILNVSCRLSLVQIEQKPAIDVIRRFNGPEVLIYADPPYLRSTRSAHADQYNHEMDEGQHVELLETLTGHRGMAMISGYDSPLYNNHLATWHKVTKATTAESGKRREECLWINPATAAKLSQAHPLKEQISLFDR